MTLTRIALRELPAHRGRVALTVLSVLLGVAFVAGTLVFSATMEKGVESAFSEVGRGTDTVVRARKTVDGGLGDTERPVPASVLEAVADAPGVAKAHGAVTGFAAVLDRRGAIVEDAPQIGMNWTYDADFSPLRLRSGAGPGADHEIAIDDGTAEKAGYRLGDRVRVALPGGVREFTLTGTFRFREAAVTAFTPAAAQRLLMERPGTYRQVAVHAAAGTSQEDVRDAVARVLPDGIEAITGRRSIEERTEEIKDLLRTLNLFVLAFAAVSLFVGSFLIFNTFAMLVAQRTRELALLRAVGAGRGQVTRLVLGEALAIGLLGSTLGLLSGIGLAALLPVFIPDVPSDGLSVPLSTVTAGYSVGLGVTLLAAYLPARRAARIPPVAALRDEEARPGLSGRGRLSAGSAAMVGGAVMIAIGLTATGSSAVGLAGGGAALVFLGVGGLSPVICAPLIRVLGRGSGVTRRLARENVLRNPRRTAATASALMIGMTLVSAVTVLAASMTASAERQLDTGLTTDFRVTPKSSVTPLSDKVVTAVAAAPGVRSAVAIRTAPLLLGGQTVSATAGEPARLLALHRLTLLEGSAALKRDELVVSQSTARSHGWRLGSVVPGEYQDGEKAGLRIAGIFGDVPDLLEAVPDLIVGVDTFRAHYPERVDRIDVLANPEAAQSLQSALTPWPNVSLKDREGIKEQYGADIRLLLQVVLGLLALSVLIAALGIVNTLALSVLERTREIGLLRAIGLGRRELRRMVRTEAMLISTAGALIGLVLGTCFAMVVQRAAAGDGMAVLSVPLVRLALFLLAGVLIGAVAAWGPARRAARMDVLRAISSP